MTLNDAYAKWKANPSSDNWELLGTVLHKYIPLFIRKHYGKHFPDVYEEAIGKTFIKIFASLNTVDLNKGSFFSWVTAIAQNTCYNISRDNRNEKLTPFDETSYGAKYTPIENRLYVKRLISQLEPSDKVLVRLKLDGFEDSEVAENMGLTLSTVKNRWKRIKMKIV